FYNGQRLERFRQQGKGLGMDGSFPGTGDKHKTAYPNEIAEVKQVLDHIVEQSFVFAGTEIVPAHIKLDDPLAVLDLDKYYFAFIINAHDPPGKRNLTELLFVFFCISVQNSSGIMANWKQGGRIGVN